MGITKRLVVYDLESFPNCFTYTDRTRTGEVTQFVIHESRNDLTSFMAYLKTVTHMVGFNNMDYDYPLLHTIIQNYDRLKCMQDKELPMEIYNVSSSIINDDSGFTAIAPWNVLIPQLDLYRIWHFNNKARSCSLKWLEIAMRFNNVEDLPFHHTHHVTTDEINTVLDYNLNDVEATYAFYERTKDKLALRKRISKMYGFNGLNMSDVKLGEKILQIEIAKSLDKQPHEIKGLRTHRPNGVNLADVIIPDIHFRTPGFNTMLNWLGQQTVGQDTGFDKLPFDQVYDILPYAHPNTVNTKKGILDKPNVIFKGVQYDFGLGGIHGICHPGIFESDDDGDVILVDVSSYYPNIAINYKFSPYHLPKDKFNEVGKKLYKMRMDAKRNGDVEVVTAIKLALNGALFGKSNDKHSFMLDIKFMLSITINGQLLLAMLSEQIALAGIQVIQINTDGIMVKCPKHLRPKLDGLCRDWQDMTGLKLDYDFFRKVCQQNVNNYLAIFTDDSLKLKGAFELNKDYHKDHSMRVIVIAVIAYFKDGVPIEQTIRNHDDIFDFCMSIKSPSGARFEIRKIVNGELSTTVLPKTNRYLITKDGGTLYRVSESSQTRLHNYTETKFKRSFKVTPFNKYYKSDNYNLDYSFYIYEALKLSKSVEPSQLSLTF